MVSPKYYEDVTFYVKEDEFFSGNYVIEQNRKMECMLAEKCGPGFYNICQARILGLSYDKYVKFCEKNYDGFVNKLNGIKFSPKIRFRNKTLAESLCLLLNKRWEELQKE